MGNASSSSEQVRSISTGSETQTPPVFAFGGHTSGARGATTGGSSGHLGDNSAGVTPPGKAKASCYQYHCLCASGGFVS